MAVFSLKKFGRQDGIGLDWGIQSLKWVKLQPLVAGRSRLVFLDSWDLPQSEGEILPALKKFVANNKLEGTPTAIGLKDESLHIRRVELPRMPEEDLKEAVRWQLRDIAEGSMDDYAVHYSVLKEESHAEVTRLTLLGYAIKKIVPSRQKTLLQQAGLKPFFIEPTPVALAASLERIYSTTEHEWLSCVDIGRQTAYFIVIHNGRLEYVQALGGVAQTQANSQEKEYQAKLAMEIQRAMDSFSITHRTEKIDKIFIGGGGADVSGLSESLTTNLGIPCEIFNPLQGIEGTEAFPLALQKPFLFGPAVGLAFLKP